MQFQCPSCQYTSKLIDDACQICNYKGIKNNQQFNPQKCEHCFFENGKCIICFFQKQFTIEQQTKKCGICGSNILEQFFQEHEQSCFLSAELIASQRVQKKQSKVKIPCQFCLVEFSKSELNQHQLNCDEGKISCSICGLKMRSLIFKQHQSSCLLSASLIKAQQMEKKESQNIIQCSICSKKFNIQNFVEHELNCFKNQQIKNKSQIQFKMVTPLQNAAICYMKEKSLKEHNKQEAAFLVHIQKLGFQKKDMENLKYYVQKQAPIIIHIHILKHMEFFIKDTHYRSQFQTNKSSGSLNRKSRTDWQDRIFDKQYSKATDFERVKYGTINFTNDPKGVSSCSSYGPSYFLLKSSVRQRCTFTDKDSSNTDAIVGTLGQCYRVLNKLTDSELKAAVQASRANEVSSKCIVTYKQIQIHGSVQFSKDIQCMYINKTEIKQKSILDMTYKFCEQNKINYEFI